MAEKQLGTMEEPRPGDTERGAPGSIEPRSASFGELVETGEDRTIPYTRYEISARGTCDAVPALVSTRARFTY